MPTSPLKTAKVAQRRKLRFETIDDCLREVDTLCHAQNKGRLQQVGNWTFGQNLHHLSEWIHYSFDGVPFKPSLLLKLLLKAFVGKHKFVNNPMPAGVKIPGLRGGTLAIEPVAEADGERCYRAALEKLRREAPQAPHMVFGPMTHEEWIKLHLRHAELHLGYSRETEPAKTLTTK